MQPNATTLTPDHSPPLCSSKCGKKKLEMICMKELSPLVHRTFGLFCIEHPQQCPQCSRIWFHSIGGDCFLLLAWCVVDSSFFVQRPRNNFHSQWGEHQTYEH